MNKLDWFYDEVARVAYDLFEKRGNVHGHDKEDWLQSEIIVKKRSSNKIEQKTRVAASQNRMKPGGNIKKGPQ